MFEVIDPDHSGIVFSNNLVENDTLNVMDFYYIYNGAGLGVGDFNNDGLNDIYFSGNQVSNQLYLNRGDFKFEDVTQKAGVAAEDIWGQGVALVDINNDNCLDIYVCASIYGIATDRKNKLFINQGLNEDGIPVFSEEAEKWGIQDTGHSANAVFFDYDLDGDLDLFVLSNLMDRKFPSKFRTKSLDGSSVNADKLYRNQGNQSFVDVSIEAGILVEGYSHGISIRDINLDGWPDIYITNDFLPNDVLYINNQDGTFTNKVSDYLKHQSFSAMGQDIADINNDGLQDIFALDMLPEINYRKKTMLLRNNPMNQINYEKFQYDLQFIRNMLQVNMGPDNDGNIVYSEIGLLAGVYETDWSWSPLFADFDNDGFKDLVVCNGFQHDVTDMDFANYKARFENLVSERLDLLDSIPIVKIANYIFKNNGDLTFTKKTDDWGFEEPTLSNGAAFADFDNDGDLDYITNNINGPATLYKNTLNDTQETDKPKFLKLHLRGPEENPHGLGAKVLLYTQGNLQFQEHSFYRGFMSTVDMTMHFGLGDHMLVDSIIVFWPGGDIEKIYDVEVNRNLSIDFRNSESTSSTLKDYLLPDPGESLLVRVDKDYTLNHIHEEKVLFDFNYQRTIPHKFSQSTPGIAVGDIDNDGLEDFYTGGNGQYPGTFYLQKPDGKFSAEERIIDGKDQIDKDMGILFLDIDNDGDLDLYIVKGGIQRQEGDEIYDDKVYLNDGNGYFTHQEDILPDLRLSGSCVKASDFDADGDLDLFVGGRVIPGKYPYPADSKLLKNVEGKYQDVTEEELPELTGIGLVNDALWTDFNNDRLTDLIVVGEWMPITFFRNTGSGFKNITESIGLDPVTGWWNSINGADIDNDGDIDYILGNLGLNTIFKGTAEAPLKIYAADFDLNGVIDPVIATLSSDEYFQPQYFPVHTRDDMVMQLSFIRNRIPTYKGYGRSTIDDIFTTEELEGAYYKEADNFRTLILLNEGNERFEIKELPVEVQFAPIFGILPADINNDGNIDLLFTGNDYAIEPMSGRIDAFNGLVLTGNGNGDFEVIKLRKAGFKVPGDAKGLARIFDADGNELYLVTQNKDSVLLFSKTAEHSFLKVPDDAQWVEISMKNGSKRKHEVYYGSSYLSQSSRALAITQEMIGLRIFNSSGQVISEQDL